MVSASGSGRGRGGEARGGEGRGGERRGGEESGVIYRPFGHRVQLWAVLLALLTLVPTTALMAGIGISILGAAGEDGTAQLAHAPGGAEAALSEALTELLRDAAP